MPELKSSKQEWGARSRMAMRRVSLVTCGGTSWTAIKRECIDHMIFFSEKSLRRAVGQYIEHFHHERPRSAALAINNQGLDNLIPFPDSPQNHSESGLIVKSERLGGLLNYYHREEKEVSEAA